MGYILKIYSSHWALSKKGAATGKEADRYYTPTETKPYARDESFATLAAAHDAKIETIIYNANNNRSFKFKYEIVKDGE